VNLEANLCRLLRQIDETGGYGPGDRVALDKLVGSALVSVDAFGHAVLTPNGRVALKGCASATPPLPVQTK
jgi:hypothetical protein